MSAQSPERLSRKQFIGRLLGTEGINGRVPFKQTLRDTLLFSAVLHTAYVAKGGFTNPLELITTKEFDIEAATTHTLGSVVKAPIKEEAIFRAWPNILLTLKQEHSGSARYRGLLVAGLFAAWHLMDIDETGFKNYLNLQDPPLNIVAGGVFLWKLARERGYLHAVLGHAVYNASTYLLNPPGLKVS